jgi:membrane fusion protein (multidrug efflux system)
MKKRMLIMLVACLVIFGGIVGFYFFKQAMIAKVFANFSSPQQTVSTTKVKATSWQPYISAVGNLKAQQSVNIMPEIAGKVVKIYFKSGAFVGKGARLLDLSDSTEQAQLKADRAQLRLAEITYHRNMKLLQRKAVSRSDIDTSFANLQAKEAAVEGDMSMIRKKKIVTPFAGKLGIRQVSLGEYLAPGSTTAIVTLSSVDPVRVQFELPQQDYPKLHAGQKVNVTVDAYPDKTFSGAIAATNAGISQDSRTILVQALVANKQRLLLPGMFVNVRISLPVKKNMLFVPQTAVTYSLYGNSIFVVNDKSIVSQRFVTLGQTEGINVLIEKGLKAGETIVTSGQLKIRNGDAIKVNNTVLPN